MNKRAGIEKLPPQNVEAEEAVLGALLIDQVPSAALAPSSSRRISIGKRTAGSTTRL